jgi:hypothetical protein
MTIAPAPTGLELGQPPRRLALPTELAPDTFAARLYGMLAPLAQQDDGAYWSLLVYCNALGAMFQLVEDIVRDTPDGPGWSIMLDLPRCPEFALGWLGQFVGVRVLPDSTADEKRQRIRDTAGMRRGTRASMVGAAAATLTGAKRVDFRERSGGPLPEVQTYAMVKAAYATYQALKDTGLDYQHVAGSPDAAYFLKVRTYGAETPDAAATLRALLSQKPGGLVLDYAVITGQTYETLKARFATYQAVKDAYVDYLACKQDQPP